MSEPRYSSKRRRAYQRRFDWDEARRRHAAGETMKEIALDMGVTRSAVGYAINRPDLTSTTPVYEPPLGMWNDYCPTCHGPKSKTSQMCRECRNDLRLSPPVTVEVPAAGPTQLAACSYGRVVLYRERWAVVEPCRSNPRYCVLHYWDGAPEKVRISEYVEEVAAYLRFEEE